MRSFVQIVTLLTLVLLGAALCPAADRIVVFPLSGTGAPLQVHRAEDLTLEGVIQAPPSTVQVIPSLDGSKYYVVTGVSEPALLVVSAASLQVTRTINLNARVSTAELTPDGRYLLAAAGSVHVIDTVLDQQAAAPIDVGGGPSAILVNDASTLAFVLADGNRFLQSINLETLEPADSVDVTRAYSIVLTRDGSRILTATRDGIEQFRSRDLSAISMIETPVKLVNARISLLPDNTRVFVENRGSGADKDSYLVNLETEEILPVGDAGRTQLRSVLVVDDTRAYAISVDAVNGSREVVRLDFEARPNISVTPLGLPLGVTDISLSPERKSLFVTHGADATLVRVNTATNQVAKTASLPVAPTGHATVYGPSELPAATMEINGGDNQYFPVGRRLPIPISVFVKDQDGRPLANAPVLFEEPAGVGVTLEPEQPSFTNTRGVASAFIVIEPDPEPPLGAEPPVEEEDVRLLESFFVSATAADVQAVIFKETIVRAKGVVEISGNNQAATETQLFPKPFAVLATDSEGTPLQAGSPITFAGSYAGCSPRTVLTDENGIARINECLASSISTNPNNESLFQHGSLAATFFNELGFQQVAAFSFTVLRQGIRLGIVKIGGDNQTAPSGTTLPEKLTFRIGHVGAGFGGTIDPFNVEVRQISGPPVRVEPTQIQAVMNRPQEVTVTLGENAGTSVIELEASLPGLPKIQYTMTATGGRPTTLEKSGDGQSGKVAATLASPLRVRVINEAGVPTPFPQVTWRVAQGDAQLTTSADTTGATASVRFGNTPGPVRIIAAIGTLQAEFNVTAVAADPASISTFSGQNQTLTTGVLSQPLVVRVIETDNRPAAAAVVTFSGPPSIRLHPVGGAAPGNPVQVLADQDGLASVRAELIAAAGLAEEGAHPSQLNQTVTITASAGSVSTSFLFNVVGRTPSFSIQGVVNAADSVSIGVVPGGLTTIFGIGLMEGVVGVAQPGGQTSFQGTTVRIGGIPAPLLALSPGPPEQINVQAPFELTPGQTTTIEIENNGSRQTVGGIPVFPAQPGIFQYEQPPNSANFFAAATHTDNRVVTPENPARHGEVVQMYATGAGRLNPPVPTGTLGPLSPLSLVTQDVIIGVDNKGSQVLFSGYAPNFLGLYQFNFVIPADAQCGNRPLSLKVGDSFSESATIPILCQ